MKKIIFSLLLILCGSIFISNAQLARAFEPRLPGNNIKVKGDITILSNNILNTRIVGPRQNRIATNPENAPFDPNDSYDNRSANNQNLPMAYIDIDGDISTFSSSSAMLNAPECSRVVYAGLYWGGTYPYNEGNNTENAKSRDPINPLTATPAANDYNRDQPYENVKFKVPGGTYVDIGPGSPAIFEYERIYDKNGDLDQNGTLDLLADVDLLHSPYLNYANVTSLLTPLGESPNGEYTIANVVGTLERKQGGSLAGWTLVIIYENSDLTSKFISTFDGFAAISPAYDVETFSYSGFKTLPGTLPVRARIGVSAMEGDARTTGPQIEFKASSKPNFTILSNGLNPSDNFFNSNITDGDAYVTSRNPASKNTFGWDTDIFQLNNPLNSVLPNNEDSADIKISLTRGGDISYVFLNTISVDIIEPDIQVEKRVEDVAGNDITGLGVRLGQTLDYVLTFQNIGNDDGKDYIIRDKLPVNTNFVSANVTGAPGTTFIHNETTNEVTFTVPNNLIEFGDPESSIRLRVKVAGNCYDFVDACTNLIQNLAFSSYKGTLNTNIITDDPSVTSISTCGLPSIGTTNFLLDDITSCDFSRTAQLCGDTLLLEAGDGFDSYTWVLDTNNNKVIDGTDTIIDDGDPDGDPSTILVNNIGTYIVEKVIPLPCISFTEIITVERFGSARTNPIIDYINDLNSDASPTNDIQGEIVSCSIDGDKLPKIFLCGNTDSQLLETSIADARSIDWERLDESSCSTAPDDCANKNRTCSWANVGIGESYTATTAGKYRLVVTYAGGCFSRFYFDVFQNTLNILYTQKDIICTSDGNITVTNLGAGYGYQLIDDAAGSILIPFSAGRGPSFDFFPGQNGSYRIEAVQLDATGNPIAGSCVFSTPPIGVLDRDFRVGITTTEANCNTEGTIKIDITNVLPDYTYVLRRADGTLIDDETAQPDNTHTFSVLPGDYTVEASTADGCFYTEDITVGRVLDPILSAVTTSNIGCSEGKVTLTTTNGNPTPYNYVVWRKNGVNLYPDTSSIPASDFQTVNTFSFAAGEGGDYVFMVVDGNNCIAFSNEVTVVDNGPLVMTPTNSPITCKGTNSAVLTIGLTGGSGTYMYSIDDGVTFQSSNTFANLGSGTYLLRVTDDLGCDLRRDYTIVEPAFALSASAGVTEVIECNPTIGAEIRILNVRGGMAPYEYSFDGGADYQLTNIGFLPAGTHNLVVRDLAGCEFPMSITVPGRILPPTFTPVIDYECDGEATVTINSTNTTDFEYTYAINAVLNAPVDSNVFTDVPVGTQTVTVNYITNTPPTTASLFLEDFGFGANTSITEIDPTYCYEPQDGSLSACGPGIRTRIDAGEYSVTQTIVNLIPSWTNPNDHTGNIDGRFLVINVGGAAGVNGIVYAKRNVEVIPNRDITISLEAFNLLKDGGGGADPSLEIELVNPAGAIIASTVTGNIPKNVNADDWQNYSVDLNPGAATNLDIVIRTKSIATSGNDIAIDDIRAFQKPNICDTSVDIPVVIEPRRAFEASVIRSTDVSCNGLADGTITFEVENFNLVDGFEYSVDGGTTYTLSTTSPVTTADIFGVGNQTILIRKVDDIVCETNISRVITEPNVLEVDAIVTTPLNCAPGSTATITVSATGGVPGYTYQLEDTGGTPITAYNFASNGTNTVFSNIPAGNYMVRVKDVNACEDLIDAPISIITPTTPNFTATPTACYSGANDAQIQVAIDAASLPGNGGFQFRINSGPWITPAPAIATTHTFDNLADGSYDIEVKDALGCLAPLQNVVVHPKISGTALLVKDLTCIEDATITLNVTGGLGTYIFEWSNTVTGPWNSTGFTTNTFTTDVDDTYFFRISDTTTPVACEVVTNSVVVTPAQLPVITSVTPTNLNCNADDSGSLNIVLDTSFGLPPYQINVFNNTMATDFGTQTSGLSAGNYTVTLTDAKGCVDDMTTVITEPDPINYTVTTVPITCDALIGGTIEGSISITSVSGGTAEYEYILTANNGIPEQRHTTAPGTRNHTFDILRFGVYKVDIVDAKGCSAFSTEIIASPPDDLDIDVSTATVDCTVGGTAIIKVSAAVGVGDYEFAILDNFLPPYSGAYQNPDPGTLDTATFTNLTPGITYTFVVHDRVTGCYYFETAATPIDSPSNLRASSLVVADVTCTGAADGNISFTFENYDPLATRVNYEIFNAISNISTGDTGFAPVNPPTGAITVTDFGVLPPGEYYLLLSEVGGAFDGCSVNGGEFTIRQSVNLLEVGLTVTKNDNCNAAGGVITATGRFGTAPYEYQLLPTGSTAPTVATWAGSSTNVFNSNSGTYDVYIKDANNCIQSNTIFLPSDPSPEISLVVVDECVPDGTYQVIVTLDVGGISPYNLSVNGAAFQRITFDASNEFTISNLSAGAMQTVEIKDLNGCGELKNFTIPPPLQFNAAVSTLLDCEVTPADNAEITIDVITGSGDYDFEITGPVNESRSALPPGGPFVWTLANTPGTYRVTVYDNNTALPNCSKFVDVVVAPAVAPILQIDGFTNVACNGANDGTITVSVPDNGIGPYTFTIIAGDGSSLGSPILPTTTSSTSATFTGLRGVAGTGIDYTIRATGANSCFDDKTRIIHEAETITNITATVLEFGCIAGNNDNSASITIEEAIIAGGSGNFVRFEFINTTTATTVQDGISPIYNETNIAGGDYTINVYDDNGCLGSTTAIINPFVAISNPVVSTIVGVTCTPGNDSEIQVSATLIPTAPATVPTLEFTVTSTDGVYDETNTTGTFTNLGVGSYTVSITNLSTNCVIKTTHTITDPNTIEAIVAKRSDNDCLDNSGSFELSTINNYSGSFSYQVFDIANVPVPGAGFNGNSNTTALPLIITGLSGGGYYITITETDAGSTMCSTNSNAITIIEPSTPLTVTVTENASPSCTNDKGVILVNPAGGTAPYDIVMVNTTTGQPPFVENSVETSQFTDLSAGNYIITITDAKGCIQTDNIILLRPDDFTPTISSTPLSCFDDNTGTIFTIEPVGRNVSATAIYEYRLNSYDVMGTTIVTTSARQTSNTFTGLGAGFYSIVVSDNFGCSFTSPIEEIKNPPEVFPQLIRTTPLTCTTGVELLLSATGGSGTYEYSVDNITWIPMVGNTEAIPNASIAGPLSAGTYSYFVRDAVNVCTSVKSNEVSEDTISPLVLALDTSAAFINCNGDSTAIIYASATGGLGNYMYELYTDASLNPTTRIAGPQSLGEFSNLIAGTYYVNVFSEDCTVRAEQVVITEPTPLEYSDNVVNPLCFGDENGEITVTLSGGSGGYQYAISPNLNQFDDENTFNKLAAGDYTVIAQDQNGCFIELHYTITVPELLNVTASTTPETCAGDKNGTIEIMIEGGTAPYRTRLSDDSNFVEGRTSFSGLAAGDYVILIEDANACTSNVIVTIEPGININATVTPIYECTGSIPNNYVNITLEDPTVIGDVLYALDSMDSNDLQLNPDFRNLSPGTHFIRIVYSNGCFHDIEFEIQNFEPLTLSLEESNLNEIKANAGGGLQDYTFFFDDVNNGKDNTYRINRSGTYTVRVLDQNGCELVATIEMEFIDIEIPTFFTPDGDGTNDLWLPRNIEQFPNIFIKVYDRYGRQVYVLPDNEEGWNGLYNDYDLPTGDYWYVIKLHGENDQREFIGHFTLYR